MVSSSTLKKQKTKATFSRFTPRGVWQGFELSAAGTSAANPIQWS